MLSYTCIPAAYSNLISYLYWVIPDFIRGHGSFLYGNTWTNGTGGKLDRDRYLKLAACSKTHIVRGDGRTQVAQQPYKAGVFVKKGNSLL